MVAPATRYIFTAFITLRNGRRLYAWQKGKKAFRIAIRNPRRGRKPR